MKLSDIFSGNTRHIVKDALLTIDIELDNGESRKKGDKVSILYEKDGKYHAEDNSFACMIDELEFEYV